MALAYLCRSMKELDAQHRDSLSFQLRAYVVDHGARDGSTEEANLVKDRLRNLGEIGNQALGMRNNLLRATQESNQWYSAWNGHKT